MALHYTTGTELVPGFRLVKLLGRGGFGEVWKASAPGGTDAAIKIISLGERTGFKELRAIRLVKQVRHPNLVPIIAYWLLTGDGKVLEEGAGDNTIVRRAQDLYLVIAMGLGDKSLHDRLKECQREGKPGIPAEELWNYLEDAARAVDYLNQPVHDLGDHTGGIQHCDLKPQNVLIVGGAAQVCDFGLARVLGDSRVTSAKGSAAYMAPEMIADNKPSKTTDQYFLAISYVELRTGSVPVDVTSPAKAIWAHVQGNLDLSKLPPEEAAVIKRATSVKPEERFESCMELARALRQAGQGAPPVSLKQSRIIKLDQLLVPGTEVVPGYKLVRLLGKGGYGHVFEASAPGGKRVALKIIRNLEGVQGRQEFKALELIKGVDHNHLMELHAFWLLDRNGNVIPDEDRDRPDAPNPSILVIASKLANKNLLQRLNECRGEGLDGIPPVELMGYMQQAAEAIDYLNTPQHQLGDRKVSIQHRDIKPENILLASGVVKVGDFGLAKVVEGTSAVIHGDSAGLTLAYAAPEMFTSVVTAWSDQYCLALTYFKLRTGGWPFPAEAKPNEIIKSHVLGKLDLSLMPEAERAVIARATAVKPETRYPTCMALVEDLERALQAQGEALPPGTLRRAAPMSQRGDNISAMAASGSSISSSSPRAIAEPPAPPSKAPYGGEEKRSPFEETLAVPMDAGPSDTAPPSITPAAGPRPSVPPPSEPVDGLEAQTTQTYVPVSPPSVSQAAPKTVGKSDGIVSRPASPRPPTVDLDASLRPNSDLAHGDPARGRPSKPDDIPKTSERPSARPPTSEPVRLPTQEMEPITDVSQTGIRPAPARGWKAGSPATPQAGPPASKGKLGIALLLLIILALAGGGVYLARDYIPLPGRDDHGAEDARQLLRERRFAEALNRLEARGVPGDVKKELQLAIRSGWLDLARKAYGEDHDYRRAASEVDELLARFPDDTEAQKLRDQAKPAAEVAEGIARGGDYVALHRKLVDARAIDDATRKELDSQLVKAWTRDVRNDLYTRHDFDQAEKLAAGLQRASDTPETTRLYQAASTAKRILDLAQNKKDFAVAARELKSPALDADLRKELGNTLALAWIDGARKAYNDNDDELAGRMVRDILDHFPGQPEAASLRDTIRTKMLNAAYKSLASAELQMKLPDAKDRVAARLRESEAMATRVLDLFNGRDPGKEDPDAYYVLGRVAELRNDGIGAYAAYSSALAEPEKADFAKLPILVGRVEFLLDPRFKKYLGDIGAFSPATYIRYADHAVALANANARTDSILKARAYAASAQARILRNEGEPPGAEAIKDRRQVAITRLEFALQIYPRDPRPWRWRVELARQYKAQMLESTSEERNRLKSEALKQLDLARQSAPTADKDQIIKAIESWK